MPIVRYAILVVLAQIIITGVHGIAHQQVGVSISYFQSAYVFLVTLAAPTAAAVMLLFLNKPKIQRGGAWLLFVSMLGSLLFGLVYHVLLPGSDNIFSVMHEPWSDNAVFTSTAILLLIVDGVGSWIGARATRIVAKIML
jgi:glucan phosphoethanolaminetransferase (alkaline phosphatase superfamily)